MRIIHVIDSMDPAQGGPPMSMAHLAAAQARAGKEVQIFTHTNPLRQEDIEVSLADIPHFERVTVNVCPPSKGFSKLTDSNEKQLLLKSVREGDILHLHGIWRPILRSAAQVAKQQHAHYVVAPRGMLDPWSLRQKRWKKRLALSIAWRQVLEQSIFLHALNYDEAELIKPLNLKCPVEIIPNGIFPEEIDSPPPKTEFFVNQPRLSRRQYILFLGRLHYKKGLDYLVEGFYRFTRRNDAVDLVVAGPDGGARADFERRVTELGITGRVHLVGALYGRRKYAAIAGALCFCLPSRQEGFSVAITEAMGCGLPVVISENCHFPEVAEVGAGEVVNLDAEAIAMALARVAHDDDYRAKAGKAGKELVLTRFTWPKIAQQSLAAYERALIAKQISG